MDQIRRLWRLFIARNKEFYRDRGTMTWNILFPVLVIGGFAFAYGGKPKPLFTVGLVNHGDKAAIEWTYTKYVDIEPTADAIEAAKKKVGRHQLDLLVDVEGATGRYWVNPTSPQGYTLEKMLSSIQGIAWERESTEGKEIRFVDWLTPGIMGLNMMFSALFGVGYVLVRYRKSGVLKRLKATPVRAWEFLLAQVFSRFALIAITTAVIFTSAVWILDIAMNGSVLALVLVFSSGALCMISLGLVVAARVSSEELAGGLLNMMTWPMMFLSGVWFSLEGLNPWLQKVSMLSPLTHMVSAARAIMIDGAGLADATVAQPIAILLILGVLALSAGAWLFRWE